jgi:hypothetical protein
LTQKSPFFSQWLWQKQTENGVYYANKLKKLIQGKLVIKRMTVLEKMVVFASRQYMATYCMS